MASNYFPGFMDRSKRSRCTKPPGGYTNDIFDLELRQRKTIVVYEDENIENKIPGDEFSKKSHESEDIPISKMTTGRKLSRSLSEGKIKQEELGVRTPPLATGKENVDAHFKKNPQSPLTISDCSMEKKLDDSEDEEEIPPKAARNPITGDVADASESKLEDATNVDRYMEEVGKAKTQRRPCIRIRQPPGGKSSIVFGYY